jgi:hypothetical protein
MRKQNRTPEKFTPYYELLDALKRDECGVCFKMRKTGRSHIDSLLYERVNDPAVRAQLRGSHGFCTRHALLAVELGDRFGMAIIYEDLLSGILGELEKGQAPIEETERCPSCVQESLSEENYLGLILSFLAEEEFRAVLENAHPFCLSHWKKLLALERDQEKRTILLQFQRDGLRRIDHHLKEFIRKHDHRFHHETFTRDEAASWRSAVGFFVGPV